MPIGSKPSPLRTSAERRARSSISTRRFARSSRLRAELVLLCSLGAGCGLGKVGTATVSARFDVPECELDMPIDGLDDYSFDARYMSTERFNQVLLVMIQKHRVDIEETDGVSFRLSLEDLLESGEMVLDPVQHLFVRPDPTVALTLPVSQSPAVTNAALSLFQTCEDFPTHPVLAGELVLTGITIAEDPADTGRMERLAGTLTATLTRSNAEGAPVGTLRVEFDFAPPRRPLTDFK